MAVLETDTDTHNIIGTFGEYLLIRKLKPVINSTNTDSECLW